VIAANSRASVDLPPPAFPNIATRFMDGNTKTADARHSGGVDVSNSIDEIKPFCF